MFRWMWVVLGVLIASPGCGGDEASDSGRTDSSASETSAEDTVAAPERKAPADPAERVFRGYLVVLPERRVFTECGTNERSWIVDLTGRELTDVARRLAVNQGDPVFVEFEGLLEPAPDVGFGADFANQIKVLELRRAALEGPGCDEDLSSIELRARGNEPFWRVDISKTGILFSDFGRSLKIEFPYAARTERGAGEWRYVSAVAGGHRIVVDIELDSCSDTMSGAYFNLSAEVEVDGRTYVGCAVEGW